MALFKILSNMVDNNPPDPYGYIDNQEDAGLAQVRSEATGLPNTFNQGYCYFDRSTGKFWIDTTPTNSGTVTLSNKNDTSKSHVQGRIPINAYYADLAKLATSATYDDAGNTIASTYLKLSGGNMTGHIYLTGSQANSSTANTSQLIFGTPTTEHIAISSNTKALILNPTHRSTTNQIVLYLDKASKFPLGIEANVKGNLTGKATTAGIADVANSVAWNNVSAKPTTLSGYGITDAKINNGTITLGNNSITPLTSHQSLSGYIPKSTLSGAFDIMYSTSANTPARLGANTTTTKKFLSMTGTGSAGAAPIWDTIDDKTDITVLPNDIGQIKTKFRLNNRGNTGNKATAWYYKLCTLPVNNGSNSASLIFSGRLGGYTSGDMSYIQGMAWNRGTPGIAIFDIGGTAAAMARIFEICDIVGYVNGDSIDAQATLTIYILCHGYFTYDLDLELYHSSSTFNYDETYITTVPSGTLAFQASTSNKRVEMINNKLLVNGTEVVTNTGSWNITAKNISNKLTIGSYEYDGSTTVTIPIYDGTYS